MVCLSLWYEYGDGYITLTGTRHESWVNWMIGINRRTLMGKRILLVVYVDDIVITRGGGGNCTS